ncbi:MAG: complement resistance protein TraT [Campylobacter sp.]|nr:complement resistance protein TraT [Campylobacter sp.]
MKNFILAFLAIFILGCAGVEPKIAVNSTQAIFITPKKDEKIIYANFKNTAGVENQSLTTYVLNEFANAGFTPTSDPQNANYVVLGDILSFTRSGVRDYDYNGFMSMGVGRRSRFFGFGMMIPIDDTYSDRYFYTMKVSVLIKQKNAEEKSTILSLKTANNTRSYDYVLPLFQNRIAKQIVGFFYNF